MSRVGSTFLFSSIVEEVVTFKVRGDEKDQRKEKERKRMVMDR